MKNVACSWSGGKDCSYALLEAKSMGYHPQVLIHMIDTETKTSGSNGMIVDMLEKQAKAMNVKLMAILTTRENYEDNFIKALKRIKNEYAIDTIIYGNIDMEEHRNWQERVCKIAGIKPVFPLWNREHETLATEIINSGIECMIVSCNKQMGKSYIGKIYNAEMIQKLKKSGINICGENGEFHSYVVNGPHFDYMIDIPDFIAKTENNHWYIDWNQKLNNNQ